MLYFTCVSDIVIARLWKYYYVSSNNTKWEIWVNKHKETYYKPSYRTTNKHGETRYRLNCREERCNRKRIHTHFLKDRNCEMQEGQKYLDSMQETHRWEAILRAAKFGRIDNSRAQSTSWDLWIGKQSPTRYRGTKFGSLKIRDETKLLKADMESFLKFGINLWRWTWNYWKLYVDTSPFKKIWDCWMTVCWIEVKSFALLLQSTNQGSKLVESTQTYRSNFNDIAE